MTNAITFSNPPTVHAPAGGYTHGVTVPAGARTLYVSGQVGLRRDGSLGKTFVEQTEQAYRNLGAILEANDFRFSDIVKLTTYVVAGQSGAEVRAVRAAYLGTHKPAATAVYVAELFSPEWLVEVEAVAAIP
jgi:2-iminobutanoate/2-iminopropanoate deaminase